MINKGVIFIFCGILIFSIGSCSVKKDRLINRSYHAMTTKYNILYNGNLAYDQAYEALIENYFDDYSQILPVEPIEVEENSNHEYIQEDLSSKTTTVLDNFSLDGLASQAALAIGFEGAEDKAVKAVQQHSMYIAGRERNWQIANAYELLGKSRYYQGRFIPALEAFNYILYKYPESDKVIQAKIWREKTNLRLSYDDIAIKNLQEFLHERKSTLKAKEVGEINAVLAQGFINIEQYPNAIASLKVAAEKINDKTLKARYLFILGQLYALDNQRAQSHNSFEQIIKLNRSIPRSYLIQSIAQQMQLKDYVAKDSIAFVKKYNKLLKDRENRPFLDVLYRQGGLFFLKINKLERALTEFKHALNHFVRDVPLQIKNYKSVAEIYFDLDQYASSGIYYDSLLAAMPEKAKDRFRILKIRESLRDVVHYEGIAHRNDSILNLVNMSEDQRIVFFEKHVDQLRKDDFKKLQANLKSKDRNANVTYFNVANFGDAILANKSTPSLGNNNKSTFYFYSTSAIGYGKQEFKRKWGDRALVDNWRYENIRNSDLTDVDQHSIVQEKQNLDSDSFFDERYDVQTYVDKIPHDEQVILDLKNQRDFAYFQLGSIYSERFKKLRPAATRFETLLSFGPVERLVLPTMYKLYKIYLEIDPGLAIALKAQIISQYPESRYAKLLQNYSAKQISDLSPEQLYTQVYRIYQAGELEEAIQKIDNILENYDNDYVSKFELLKANIIARLQGIDAYRDALNFIALTYSSTPEGIIAETTLQEQVEVLSNRDFSNNDKGTWKIVVLNNTSAINDYSQKQRNFSNFALINKSIGVKYSEDYYLPNQEFMVLHGFRSKEDALKILERLEVNDAIVISTENYIVVQIKKNWEDYLAKE